MCVGHRPHPPPARLTGLTVRARADLGGPELWGGEEPFSTDDGMHPRSPRVMVYRDAQDKDPVTLFLGKTNKTKSFVRGGCGWMDAALSVNVVKYQYHIHRGTQTRPPKLTVRERLELLGLRPGQRVRLARHPTIGHGPEAFVVVLAGGVEAVPAEPPKAAPKPPPKPPLESGKKRERPSNQDLSQLAAAELAAAELLLLAVAPSPPPPAPAAPAAPVAAPSPPAPAAPAAQPAALAAKRQKLDADLRALDLETETALRELAALMERARSRRAALCLERDWVETQLALRLTAAAADLPVAVPPLVAGSVEATWAANAI